ncbi:hypothetical protein J2X58_000766 [Luteibacter sp. 3190]|nr:hypothetical protein [Luteibacter sp. 3190]
MNGRSLRCPRFDSCNANVCPLDPQWPRAEHRQGERVCGLLTELAKVDGQAQVATVLSSEQFDTLVREWPKVEARWGDIRYRLKNAAKTGSRIANAKARFHTQPQGTQPVPLPDVPQDVPGPHRGALSAQEGAA